MMKAGRLFDGHREQKLHSTSAMIVLVCRGHGCSQRSDFKMA